MQDTTIPQENSPPIKSHEPRIKQMPNSLKINFSRQRLQKPETSAKEQTFAKPYDDTDADIGEEG
jgi:hypothetical protein